MLADFFIGAHAAVAGLPVLTRDVRRFAGYFPVVALIAPDSGSSALMKRRPSRPATRAKATGTESGSGR